MPTTDRHNLLVISDIHLGQELNGLTDPGALQRIARLDRELEAFLEHYTGQRVDGRPWRLVLAGDVFDFWQITLRPQGSEAVTRWHRFELSADEQQYGLGHGPWRAVWKLERIVERHPGVFLRLAEFAAAGHEIAVIRGNHDDELCWTEVQEAFVHLLEELYEQAHPAEAWPRERVRFYPWFFYEKGLFYVEHGHQYDPYSSFEYFLDPPRPSRGHTEMPVPLLAQRYFANRFPGFPTLEQDRWTLLDYLRWTRSVGIGPFRIVAMFLQLMVKVFFRLGRGRLRPGRDRGWLDARLGDLSSFYDVPRETLHRLAGLQAPPVGHSLFGSLQVFFLDRLAAVAGLAGVATALALLPVAGWVHAGTIGLAVVLGVVLLWWLGRMRHLAISAGVQQAAAARDLAEQLGVKFVIMGHSHQSGAHPTSPEGRSWYVNTGTWSPPADQPIHEAHCDCDLTHLAVIDDARGARASLRRWCGAARRPEIIEEVG